MPTTSFSECIHLPIQKLMKLTRIQFFYLALALIGIIAPWYFNILFYNQYGFYSALNFIKDGFATPAASSNSTDLIICLVLTFVWIPFEARKQNMKQWWIYILIGMFVSVATAWGLFLYARDRHLTKNN